MILTAAQGHRERVAAGLAAGRRFAGLHASAGGTLVHVLLAGAGDDTEVVTSAAAAGALPSILDLAPAANWDEREAHDLFGVRFDGHDPLRPLVEHDLDLGSWTVPVGGRGTYQVAVGPIHAGVIESGHFRFHVIGDRILHLDARLFYKHRGLERAAEGRTLEEGLPYVARACGACAVANGLAYAHACERTLGLRPTAELARARTVLLELERTWSHLNDIAAVCAGVGFAAVNNHFAALTEEARRLNADLAGHRFLFGAVQVGRSDLAIDAAAAADARERLAGIAARFRRGWRALLFDWSFQDRLPGIGRIDPETARSLGTVGPAARASGVPLDARAGTALLAYPGFEPAAPEEPTGDVRARLEQRAVELEQTLDLLDELLAGPVAPAGSEPGGAEAGIGVGRVESARGETTCAVERDGDHLVRVRLRTGSYANWPTVAHSAAGNLVPDFPLINKSFELCYACAER